MNDFGIDDDDFTDAEIADYLNETIDEYDTWNVNLDTLVSNLTASSKIFLSELHEKVGDKIFYMIYGYLNSESLIDYDELTIGGMSKFINELESADTLNLIELFIDFKKQSVELTESDMDFEQIIKKLKSIMHPKIKTTKSNILISPLYYTSGNSFTPFASKLLSA